MQETILKIGRQYPSHPVCCGGVDHTIIFFSKVRWHAATIFLYFFFFLHYIVALQDYFQSPKCTDREVLGKVTSVAQKAYSPDRYMHEAIINTVETIKPCQSQNVEGVLLSVDLHKAFDRLLLEFHGDGIFLRLCRLSLSTVRLENLCRNKNPMLGTITNAVCKIQKQHWIRDENYLEAPVFNNNGVLDFYFFFSHICTVYRVFTIDSYSNI